MAADSKGSFVCRVLNPPLVPLPQFHLPGLCRGGGGGGGSLGLGRAQGGAVTRDGLPSQGAGGHSWEAGAVIPWEGGFRLEGWSTGQTDSAAGMMQEASCSQREMCPRRQEVALVQR